MRGNGDGHHHSGHRRNHNEHRQPTPNVETRTAGPTQDVQVPQEADHPSDPAATGSESQPEIINPLLDHNLTTEEIRANTCPACRCCVFSGGAHGLKPHCSCWIEEGVKGPYQQLVQVDAPPSIKSWSGVTQQDGSSWFS